MIKKIWVQNVSSTVQVGRFFCSIIQGLQCHVMDSAHCLSAYQTNRT